MTNTWIESVNQPPVAFSLDKLEDFFDFKCEKLTSAIDEYYVHAEHIIKTANVDFCKEHQRILPYIAVSLISITEDYFRNIFSNIIRICPKSQQQCARQSVNFGSVIWYRGVKIERGAFEHISFSSKEHINNACKNFLDIDIKNNKDVQFVVDEFQKCCEIRHCIVHSNCYLSGKNALSLNIMRSGCFAKILIDYNKLQDIALVCNNLIKIINKCLFEQIAIRWAKIWPSFPFWNKKIDFKLFKDVWSIFHSNIDDQRNTIPYPMTLLKCKNAIVRQMRR